MSPDAAAEATSVALGRLVWRSPGSSGTDIALAVQCAWLAWRLARTRAAEPSWRACWTAFFVLNALGAAAGAVKHGLPHYLTGTVLAAVVVACNVGTGLAPSFAQLASVERWRASGRVYRWLTAAVHVQIGAFAAATAFDRSFLLVVSQMALALTPVMAAELLAHRRGQAGAGLIALGVALSYPIAAVYVLRVSPSPWLDHIGLSHVLMMGTLLLVYHGARLAAPAPRLTAAGEEGAS